MGWTRDYVFQVFKDAVRHVWRNADFVLPKLTMSDEEPAGKVYASISFVGNPWANTDSIIQSANQYTLRVSNPFLQLNEKQIWQVMVHEAVHIGVRGHNKEFRRLVIEKGGIVAGRGVDSGGVIQIQKREPGTPRYVTVREFGPEEEIEAYAWGKAQSRAPGNVPGTRWRAQFGEVA